VVGNLREAHERVIALAEIAQGLALDEPRLASDGAKRGRAELGEQRSGSSLRPELSSASARARRSAGVSCCFSRRTGSGNASSRVRSNAATSKRAAVLGASLTRERINSSVPTCAWIAASARRGSDSSFISISTMRKACAAQPMGLRGPRTN
jgi:hypothetical protein